MVATLLSRNSIGAAVRVLDMAEQITVAPYFVIQNRHLQLSRSAERVLSEGLSRL